MSVYDTIDRNAIGIIRKIYDRYNISRIIDARDLDFQWRKDGQEGHEQADAIKDLLRYVPGLLRIAEQNPDADYVASDLPHTDMAPEAARTPQAGAE